MSWAYPGLSTVVLYQSTVALYRGRATVFYEPGPSGFCGRAICTGWNNAIQLRATAASCLSLTIKAYATNVATAVYVGFSNVATALRNRGYPLAATPEGMSMDIDDPSKVWICGTAADGVSFFGLARR